LTADDVEIEIINRKTDYIKAICLIAFRTANVLLRVAAHRMLLERAGSCAAATHQSFSGTPFKLSLGAPE
jgi:hypothetical protein